MTTSNRSLSNWENVVEAELDTLDKSIEIRLLQTGLNVCFEKEEIKNTVFLIFKKRVASGKIRVQQDNSIVHFFTLKSSVEEPIHKLRPYLRTCLFNEINRIFHLYKKQKTNQVNIDDFKESVSQTLPNSSFYRDNPEDWIEKCELRDKMHLLENEDRLILELFYFEDLSFEEIAKRLKSEGSPVYRHDYLRKKKQRAMDRLRLLY